MPKSDQTGKRKSKQMGITIYLHVGRTTIFYK